MKYKNSFFKFILSMSLVIMMILTNATSTFADTSKGYDEIGNSIINESDNENLDSNQEYVLDIPLEDDEFRNILGFEYIQVRINMKYNSSQKKHIWSFNVDVPTSLIKKPPIKLKVQILRSNTEGGVYSNYGSPEDFGLVNTSKDYIHKVTAKTGYYKVKVTYQIKRDGSAVFDKAKSKNASIGLVNRTGKKWTQSYSDKRSGKKLGKPRADYVKGTIHKRPSNLNKKYYDEYKRKYGVTLRQSLYDVHHIKPLAYGGDNSFSNLIHLPKNTHKVVTSWFAGY